ncbi:MAG: ribulose bisphosphate carboxylase small subunit [Phormidesmis sp.]
MANLLLLMAYYIAPNFLDKLAVHITKNYLELPQVKIPLILGIHGRKGEGKTFQCELVFERMGVEVVYISGGELESPDAGDPARLIRLRYREAAELVRVRGCMAVLMINDLDAGAGRFDRMTQYTVNTQLVNNTLMNIADNPTNVQLPGSYDEKELPRIPIIATGNDFATLYAPLIRDGRMQKYYWEPTYEDRLGIMGGMFADDGLSPSDVEKLVKHFDAQAIDFFGAVRSQVYDEQITEFIHSIGVEKIASRVVNTLKLPSFTRPNFQIEHLIEVGESLVREQEHVRTMGLVSEYNQAVTPAGYSAPERRRDATLLTPPAHNPLSPYRIGREDSNSKDSGSEDSGSEASDQNNGRSQDSFANSQYSDSQYSDSQYSSASSYSNGRSSRALAGLPDAIAQPLQAILSHGHRLGIEHVDQRRFRINSWQSYATLDTTNKDAAVDSLQSCLSQFPNDYIRLVSIDPRTKQRLTETIVQRPQ